MLLTYKPALGAALQRLHLLCGYSTVQSFLLHSYSFIPVCSDYCIALSSVSSLSLSRSLSGSASLAFQRSSQSEEIYRAPTFIKSTCYKRYVVTRVLRGEIISVSLIRLLFPYAQTIASHFCVLSLSRSACFRFALVGISAFESIRENLYMSTYNLNMCEVK
jgi:hypothetical protein